MEQRLGDAATASVPVHTDVLHIAALVAVRVLGEDGADQGARGELLAVLALDERQPPVVPPVTGVLAEALHELGEALPVGVEVVLEGRLEHLVDQVQVPGDRQPVLVAGDPADGDAFAGWRQRSRLVGRDRARHLRPRAALGVARVRQPSLLDLVLRERAGVQPGLLHLAQDADLPGLSLGPAVESTGELVRLLDRAVEVERDHGSAGRAVVDAHPRTRTSVGVDGEQLAPRPGRRSGHLGLDGFPVDRGGSGVGEAVGAAQLDEDLEVAEQRRTHVPVGWKTRRMRDRSLLDVRGHGPILPDSRLTRPATPGRGRCCRELR